MLSGFNRKRALNLSSWFLVGLSVFHLLQPPFAYANGEGPGKLQNFLQALQARGYQIFDKDRRPLSQADFVQGQEREFYLVAPNEKLVFHVGVGGSPEAPGRMAVTALDGKEVLSRQVLDLDRAATAQEADGEMRAAILAMQADIKSKRRHWDYADSWIRPVVITTVLTGMGFALAFVGKGFFHMARQEGVLRNPLRNAQMLGRLVTGATLAFVSVCLAGIDHWLARNV